MDQNCLEEADHVCEWSDEISENVQSLAEHEELDSGPACAGHKLVDDGSFQIRSEMLEPECRKI